MKKKVISATHREPLHVPVFVADMSALKFHIARALAAHVYVPVPEICELGRTMNHICWHALA